MKKNCGQGSYLKITISTKSLMSIPLYASMSMSMSYCWPSLSWPFVLELVLPFKQTNLLFITNTLFSYIRYNIHFGQQQKISSKKKHLGPIQYSFRRNTISNKEKYNIPLIQLLYRVRTNTKC